MLISYRQKITHINFSLLYFNHEDCEDTKWVITIHKSKKDRQRNGQKTKDKRTNNNLQNIHKKTKDQVTRT